jgi:hypothetical protein
MDKEVCEYQLALALLTASQVVRVVLQFLCGDVYFLQISLDGLQSTD